VASVEASSTTMISKGAPATRADGMAHIILDLLARLRLPRCPRYGGPAGLGAKEF
jgi:hypothetical protein